MPLQQWARRLGHRPQHRHRPARREPRPAARRRSGATRCYKQGADRPALVGRATTSTSSVGQGDLQANPLQMAVAYAAIANGGRVLRPRLGPADRGRRRAARSSSSTPRRPAQLEDQARVPPGDPRGPARRRERAGRHLDAGVPGLPDPDRRQDRHRRARSGRPTSPGTWRWRRTRTRKYVVAVTDEAGGFGADTAAPDGAPHPGRAVRRQGERAGPGRRGAATDARASAATAVKDFRDDAGARFLRDRPADAGGHARADRRQPLHRRRRHAGRHPGRPELLPRTARPPTRRSGIVLMLADLALRLLAPARVEARHLRVPDRLDPARVRARRLGPRVEARDRASVLQLPAVRARQGAADRRRWRRFMVDRIRRLDDRETTSRIVLLAVIPAMLVIAQPDLGSGLVYLAIARRDAVRRRHPVDPLRGARRARRGGDRGRAGGGARRSGVEVLKPYQVDRLTAFLNPARTRARRATRSTSR